MIRIAIILTAALCVIFAAQCRGANITLLNAFDYRAAVQKTHLTDGALFDRIQRENKTNP